MGFVLVLEVLGFRDEFGEGGGYTIFCPPGPLPLRKVSRRSCSGIWAKGGRCLEGLV